MKVHVKAEKRWFYILTPARDGEPYVEMEKIQFETHKHHNWVLDGVQKNLAKIWRRQWKNKAT